jgi:pimeloyl-ACP methyl ester carboxylesterase/AraC-like DNA-binding protein
MQIPETRYAKSGNINIAYQVTGQGPQYLIIVPGWCSNIEECWNIPQLAAWLQYLASFNTLVLFDKRGTGLSDRVHEQELPGQEQRAEDLQAVMQAIGITKAALLGISEGGAMALLFAYRYPEQVSHLILYATYAKWIKSDDYPYGLTREQHNQTKQYIFEHWGQPVGLHLMAPDLKDDMTAQNQWAAFLRRSASPGTAAVFYEMNTHIDVRSILHHITMPVLIMHRKNDRLIEAGHSYYLHQHMSHAQLMVTEGNDHLPWYNMKREEIIAIFSFLHGNNAAIGITRDLLTIEDMFTLYAIRDYILHHFQENITLTGLTRQFGINVFKIKSGFRLLFDNSVIRFLTETRLENARKLLTEPNETVASVADQVCYKHPNNFSMAFKRRYGITPQQYKARIKNGQG